MRCADDMRRILQIVVACVVGLSVAQANAHHWFNGPRGGYGRQCHDDLQVRVDGRRFCAAAYPRAGAGLTCQVNDRLRLSFVAQNRVDSKDDQVVLGELVSSEVPRTCHGQATLSP